MWRRSWRVRVPTLSGVPFAPRRPTMGGYYMFRIAYIRIDKTDLYTVRLFCIDQIIVVNKRVLMAQIDMSDNAVCGCQDVPVSAIIDLGFVFPFKSYRLAE